MSTDLLIGVVRASEKLGCSDAVIRKLCTNGKLKGAVKKSGHWFVPEESLVGVKPSYRPRRVKPPLEPRGSPDANTVRQLHDEGYSYAQIGAAYGVTRQWAWAMGRRDDAA